MLAKWGACLTGGVLAKPGSGIGCLQCAWGMGQPLSMATRHEITKKYAREYARASKKDKGRMLDELVAVTGWSRANARRAVTRATKRRGTARSVQRKPRARTYGYDTLKVLIEVWMLIGQPCGKYLVPIMALTVAQLEAFGELGRVADRLGSAVREQWWP